MAGDINVTAHPYPSNFSSLSREERNAYFAAAARDYAARNVEAIPPEGPPLRTSDHREGEPQCEPDNALAERHRASARLSLGVGASCPEATDASASPVTFMPKRYKYRDPSTIPPREFLYGRHYIRQFLSATVAPGGVGKSGLSIVECLAMVEGRALLGERPVKPLNVWYWNLEDSHVEIERRIAAAQLHFDVDPEAMQERLSFSSGRDMSLVIATQTKSGALISDPVEAALSRALIDNQIDVLVIDPFVSAHRVSENDNPAIDAVVKAFGRIAGFANCAVELVHHVRKTGGGVITAEDSRGASALVAAARSVRVLNPMSRDEAEKLGLEATRRSYFRFDTDKANIAPHSAKPTWFRHVSVSLRNPNPPYKEDSVGVVTSWDPPSHLDGVTVDHLREVQSAVAAGRWRHDPQAAEWAGNAVASVLKLDVTRKAHKAKIKGLLKVWIANRMFVVVEREDAKRTIRKFVEVGEPVND
jgi:hypothetical protein